MTENYKETILMIKGAISELPAADREACHELAEHFRRQVKSAGEVVGVLAFSLVGAEMQQATITIDNP